MTDRRYYSLRTGRHPLTRGLDLPLLKKLFFSLCNNWEADGFFAGHLGFYCVDAGHCAGKRGGDIPSVLLRDLRKENLWPMHEYLDEYSEDDLFDMIEWLHDQVSPGIKDEGEYHRFNECGYHYSKFEWGTGGEEYRREVNRLLSDYGDGYELTAAGEVVELADAGLEPLLAASAPGELHKDIDDKIALAIKKFRARSSSWSERRDAVRDLADVLEYLRPKVREVLLKNDEKDLFNIANNFAIRHHNERQKADYDPRIWSNWMFYFYLSTIHAVRRMIKRQEIDGRGGS